MYNAICFNKMYHIVNISPATNPTSHKSCINRHSGIRDSLVKAHLQEKHFISLNQWGCIFYSCKIQSNRCNEVCETNIQYPKCWTSAERAMGCALCECEDNSNYENWKENKWKSSSGEQGERSSAAEQTHRVIDSEHGRPQPRVHVVMIAL